MNRIAIYITAVALSVVSAFSQQLPVMTLGFENPQFYNPAASAFKNTLSASFGYRQQWAGIPGAPETFVLSVDGKPADKMGLGLTLYNDRTDILGQLGLFGNYAYKLKFMENHSIGLGLSAGLIHNQIFYDRIKASQTDENVLLDYSEKGTKFDAGAGLRYSYKDILFVDFSALNLMKGRYTFEEQNTFKEQRFQLMTHYIVSMGYSFILQEGRYRIDPWTSFRSVQGLPLQYEGNLSFTWNDLVKATGGYRQDAGAYAALQFRLFESIGIGYARDFPNKYIKSVSSGSNEIFLSVRISGKVKTVRDNISSKEINVLKKQSQEQYQEIERLQQENQRLVKQQALNDSLFANQKEEIEHLKSIFAKDRAEVEKAKEKYEVKGSDIDSIASNTLDKAKSFYVIVGSYLTLADAKFFQKILEREAGLQTLVFEREDGKYYFVYSRQVKSQDEANREFKRLRKMDLDSFINGNIWIYGEK
ncbi:MAG: PorP/SprF family type IX secretion system membrane protein [Breznakibacter sp.]